MLLSKRLEMQTKFVGLVMTQLHKHEVLGSNPQHLCEKPGPGAGACNPKARQQTWEGPRGSPWPLKLAKSTSCKFTDRPCLKK